MLMKIRIQYNLVLLIGVFFAVLLQLSCSSKGDVFIEPIPSAKKELNANDSITRIINQNILQELEPGINSLMLYINQLVNHIDGPQFTSAQLGQILNHFRPTDPEIDKIIDQGKKYPNQTKAKDIWNQIFLEYSNGDKIKFIKSVTNYGDIYHLNRYIKEWNKRHPGSELVQSYNKDQQIYNLEVFGKRHEAMELSRAENAGKIQTKIKENLQFQAKKLNEEGFKISSEQVNNALNIIMNEYVSCIYNSAKMLENAEKIDKLIEGQLGVKLKTSLINELFLK